jgi:hypothetical protein
VASPPNFKTNSPTKQFSENWLQALTLSISSPSARLVKPLMSDIDQISQSRDVQEQLAAADRVWSFSQENKIAPLLVLIPSQQTDWTFSDEEVFTYQNESKANLESKEAWIQSLGLAPGEFVLKTTATSGDWAELLRKEAVRQRRPMSAQSMQTSSLLEQNARASWQDNQWKVRFELADWISITYDEAFETSRPNATEAEEAILTALMQAEPMLLPKSLPVANLADTGTWSESIEALKPLHKGFLSASKSNSNAWLRKVWSAVWPVIYREQNQLHHPCDLQLIRQELADCFQHVPKATLWMFVAAKLVCSSQLGRGLGICGNFKR